jgi:hypothetical protein
MAQGWFREGWLPVAADSAGVISPHRRSRTCAGAEISPKSPLTKANFSLRRCWICIHGAVSGSPWVSTTTPSWPGLRCAWLSRCLAARWLGCCSIRTKARHAVAAWIDESNTDRRHSTNGMLSPLEYERARAVQRDTDAPPTASTVSGDCHERLFRDLEPLADRQQLPTPAPTSPDWNGSHC